MKKLIFVFALTSTLISCKKETSSPTTSNGNNSIDTTKNVDTTTQTVTTPLINSLDCSGAVITGSLKMGDASNTVTVKINYSGGNGKAYPAQSTYSTSVTGLTAKLTAGTLVNGNGSVLYEISGNPASVGTANFDIKFGGKTCSIQLKIEEIKPTSGYGPNIDDVDGNSYKTVYIGTQHWMGENLKVSKYNDGTAIPKITDNTQWSLLTTGAWTYYNKVEANEEKYGKLYNWYAVSPTTNGNKNVCPTGWHVPTDAEWKVLIDYLGGTFVAGGKMKEVGTTNWVSPNKDATNTSLFTGLPGAYRILDGGYYNIGSSGAWWSSTEYNTSSVLIRMLDSYSGATTRQTFRKAGGCSVRCLKD
jgi:uncharacterized protein (TIGR02145 family)